MMEYGYQLMDVMSPVEVWPIETTVRLPMVLVSLMATRMFGHGKINHPELIVDLAIGMKLG